MQTPYWGSGSKEDERERFQDELWSVAEAAGLERRHAALGTSGTSSRTSRVTESLITELDEGTAEASSQIIVSRIWTRDAVSHLLQGLLGRAALLNGDSSHRRGAATKPGHAAVADLSTTLIGWASSTGQQRAKELADVLRNYRDKQMAGPGSSESPLIVFRCGATTWTSNRATSLHHTLRIMRRRLRRRRPRAGAGEGPRGHA